MTKRVVLSGGQPPPPWPGFWKSVRPNHNLKTVKTISQTDIISCDISAYSTLYVPELAMALNLEI